MLITDEHGTPNSKSIMKSDLDTVRVRIDLIRELDEISKNSRPIFGAVTAPCAPGSSHPQYNLSSPQTAANQFQPAQLLPELLMLKYCTPHIATCIHSTHYNDKRRE